MYLFSWKVQIAIFFATKRITNDNMSISSITISLSFDRSTIDFSML